MQIQLLVLLQPHEAQKAIQPLALIRIKLPREIEQHEAVVPILLWSWSLARRQQWTLHKRVQLSTAVVLGVVVLLIEIDLNRIGGTIGFILVALIWFYAVSLGLLAGAVINSLRHERDDTGTLPIEG